MASKQAVVPIAIKGKTKAGGKMKGFIRRAAIVLSTIAVLSALGAANASAELKIGLQWTGSQAALEMQEEWNAVQKSGAKYYRIPFSAEKSANGLDWSTYNRIFTLASERNIRILPIMSKRPAGGGQGVPGGEAEWYEFLRRSVKRYGYGGSFWTDNPGLSQLPVEAWEIWNEPNNPGETGGVFVPAWEYGQFLASSALVIQNTSQTFAGRRTQVLFGGLLMWNGKATAQKYFENAWNEVSGANDVTGVAIHPYSMCGNQLEVMKNTVTGVRNYMNSHNGASRPIWITEIGWPLGTWEFKNNENIVECVLSLSEISQASLMQGALDWYKAETNNLNIPTVIWYNPRDSDHENKWDYRSGLRDEAGNFRRGWFMFQKETGVPRWPIPTVAFQANTGRLWTFNNSGTKATVYGMKAGTSPSGGLTNGAHMAMFQANTGNLFSFTSAGASNTLYGMQEGTSPSITPLEGGHVAFHGNTGTLLYYEKGGPLVNTGVAMAPGTSPSIAALPDLSWKRAGFVIAFQGSNGNLKVMEKTTSGVGPIIDTGYGMKAGTSPSVAAIDTGGRYAVAFQANTGNLWVMEPNVQPLDTGRGMKAGTSPAITGLPDPLGPRYAVAFQANTGELWVHEPGGFSDKTGYGMAANTSPSITTGTTGPHYKPHVVAFNASNGTVWLWENGGQVTNSLYGFLPGTSPSISGG